jgi:hypothetical protein
LAFGAEVWLVISTISISSTTGFTCALVLKFAFFLAPKMGGMGKGFACANGSSAVLTGYGAKTLEPEVHKMKLILLSFVLVS